MNVKQFIDAVREEKDGFKYGKPWRYTKSSLVAILPVTRKSKEQREYITLAEAGKKVVIEDSGSISEAVVHNKDKKPVFIRAGEILKGSTQTRAVVVSRVIMPKQTATLKIVCVYASKGISQGAEFGHAGYAPYSVEKTIMNESVVNINNVNQHRVWNSVSSYSSNLGGSGGASGGNARQMMNRRVSHGSILRGFDDSEATQMDSALDDDMPMASVLSASAAGYANKSYDDLEGNMKEYSLTMQELFKSLPKVDWQVGAVLLGVKGILGMEVFDLADSWTALKEELAEKEAENLVKEEQSNAFEFNPKKARYMTDLLLKAKFSEKDLYKDEETRTVGLEIDKFVGQVTLLGTKVIHLNLTEKN